MDSNHPIPQDVTGFQFRLIGNMTVKQFGYLALAGIFSVIIYYAPLFILLKVIFVPLFAGLGVAFAFLPIEGRPMDAMVGYFFRALISPNQYVYHKIMGHFSFDSIHSASSMPHHLSVAVQKRSQSTNTILAKQQQLKKYLDHMDKKTSATDTKEATFLSSILATSSAIPAPLPVAMPVMIAPQPIQTLPDAAPAQSVSMSEPANAPAPAPSPMLDLASLPNTQTVTMPSHTMNYPQYIPQAPTAVTLVNHDDHGAIEQQRKELEQKEEAMKKQEEEMRQRQQAQSERENQQKEELALAQKQSEKVADETTMTHTKLLELEKSLQEMAAQKQQLEKELHQLKGQASLSSSAQSFTPTTLKEEPKQQTQLVRQVPQTMTQKKGLPATPDFPNILLGVVKDSSENILPNVLIEVKDTKGNPVRAFKTNQLGQFASATPLANGTYTIDFEDTRGKNKFDTIELVAKGEILLPIEVISHDLREELRKELFS